MKAWFGPLPGSNTGYQDIRVRYAVMPVSWEGWLVTAVYFAVQFAAGFAVAFWAPARWANLWLVTQVVVLHLTYLWMASRRYVTRAEMDPYVLPADMRGKGSEE